MMDASDYNNLILIGLLVVLSISYIGSIYYTGVNILFTLDAFKRWTIDYIKYKIHKRKQS